MSREAQVRFREDVGVQVPCVTRFGGSVYLLKLISVKDKSISPLIKIIK
jgi:hypothetical protein